MKNKLLVYLFTFLLFWNILSLTHGAQCQKNTPLISEFPFEGYVTFKVYPDESIKVEAFGGLEQILKAVQGPPPVYNVVFNLVSSPAGQNLTEVGGDFLIKLNPIFSLQLSGLDLNIESHIEDQRLGGTWSNTSLLFYLPGYLGVNGTTGTYTDEAGESIIKFETNVKLWYKFYPQENIQEFIQSFPLFKSQLTLQIYELTDGNITLRDLTLARSEIGSTLATFTLSGRIEGNIGKGILAYSAKMTPTDTVAPIPSEPINLDEYRNLWPKSGDFYLRFDKNEMAFKLNSFIIIEGNLDKQYNKIKDLFLEGLLQSPQTAQETAGIINNLLLPTEMRIENLNIMFEYLFDGEKYGLSFTIDGFGFKPPTIMAFLTILNEALTGVSMPKFSLTLEGEYDEKEFVEIEVPETTTEPFLLDKRKAVWSVDNLVNINLVSFKVREWPTLTSTVSKTEVAIGDTVDIDGILVIEGEPVAEQKVEIVINDIVVETVETDSEGGFAYTHKFEDSGGYEIKVRYNYFEKTLESPITTGNVKPSSLFTPTTTAFIVVGVVVLTAVGYILMKKR